MRFTITVCFLLAYTFAFAQVGINTTSPETTLDIRAQNHNGAVTATDGILVPRINNLGVDGSVNGQLVYLTADDTTYGYSKGFHYWDGLQWEAINDANPTLSVKYTNNSNAQNLNTGGYTAIQIFNSLSWNDDTSVFEFVSTTKIRIKTAGRYQIRANLGLIQGDDVGLEMRVGINGSTTGSTYIADTVQNDDVPKSIHLSETFNLNTNDEIELLGRRTSDSDNSKPIRLDTASDSYIEIIKIN